MHPARRPSVGMVIPAYNEEQALPAALAGIPPEVVDSVVVVDNASSDGTAEAARQGGAVVVHEPRRGYGAACLAGIGWYEKNPVDVIVFMDADGADDPSMIKDLVAPIAAGEADLVIGSRVLGQREPGALTPHAALGNRLAVFLIRLLFGHAYTDLGPFRAVRSGPLASLGMADRDYGWTVEMQVKAIKQGLRIKEAPVPYRRRAGKSKISGTFKGSVVAGWKIITTIFRLRLAP